MKIKILFLSVFFCALTLFSLAQGQQRRTVEERVKRVVDTMTTVFKIEKTVQDQASVVFTEYYTSMDKLRESLPEGERPDRAEIDKLTAARDEKLKKILNQEQFITFKDDIEPALRPRRRQ